MCIMGALCSVFVTKYYQDNQIKDREMHVYHALVK
jgi:hypothetical protein